MYGLVLLRAAVSVLAEVSLILRMRAEGTAFSYSQDPWSELPNLLYFEKIIPVRLPSFLCVLSLLWKVCFILGLLSVSRAQIRLHKPLQKGQR